MPDVVVATPGRMIDHLRNSMSVDLDDLAVLILDEADRLLELGFSAEIRELVYLGHLVHFLWWKLYESLLRLFPVWYKEFLIFIFKGSLLSKKEADNVVLCYYDRRSWWAHQAFID